MTRVWWGRGRKNGSFVPVLNHKGQDHQLFSVWTSGRVEVYFYWYLYKEPFRSEEKRRALLDRLNAIEGVSLQDDVLARRPSIPLANLDPSGIKQLQKAFEWVIDEIKKS